MENKKISIKELYIDELENSDDKVDNSGNYERVGQIPSQRGDIVRISNPMPDEDPKQLYVVVQKELELYSDDEQIDVQILGTGLPFAPINRIEKKDLAVVVPAEKVKDAHDWLVQQGAIKPKKNMEETFSKPSYPTQFGIFVYGKLHDTYSDELTADSSAHSLRAIHPMWKVEVHPVDESGNIISTDVDGSIVSESQSNRMIELVKSFEEKREVIKEKKKSPDQEKLKEEKKRLQKIAKLDEANQFNYFTGNVPQVMGNGQTVNTIFDSKNLPAGQTVNTAFQNNASFNPNSNRPYNPNYTYLQPAEALRLAISRVLNSGAAVNNLGFYEEVNRELNILGFDAKSPLDIKQAILKMIKD